MKRKKFFKFNSNFEKNSHSYLQFYKKFFFIHFWLEMKINLEFIKNNFYFNFKISKNNKKQNFRGDFSQFFKNKKYFFLFDSFFNSQFIVNKSIFLKSLIFKKKKLKLVILNCLSYMELGLSYFELKKVIQIVSASFRSFPSFSGKI